MHAVEFHEFGGPDVLHATEVPVPEPAHGEVTVDVAYAGVNFADVLARAHGYRVPALPFRPGLEISGRIRAVGPGVEGLRPGQEVAALTSHSGYAEVAVAPAATVFALPEGISLRTAATLPTVLPTVQGLVHEVGRLRAGETVLVQSAAAWHRDRCRPGRPARRSPRRLRRRLPPRKGCGSPQVRLRRGVRR